MDHAKKRLRDSRLLKASREQLEEDEECVLCVGTIFGPIEFAPLLSPTHSSLRIEREGFAWTANGLVLLMARLIRENLHKNNGNLRVGHFSSISLHVMSSHERVCFEKGSRPRNKSRCTRTTNRIA